MTDVLDLTANANTHWSDIFITELGRAGLRHVCFAPGSRSTPLVLAAESNPDITLHRHLDERSAGFFALGLAHAVGRPVALICTSGTAVANFHPAVIEAFQSHVPLIVLSADRPPELRGSGANQTIDQLKLFGDHIHLFIDMPVPQEDASAVTLRHLRTAAARVHAAASGPIAGPVHVNFPFRKPLEPPMGADNYSQPISTPSAMTPFTRFESGRLAPSESQVRWLADLIAAEPEGIILCGPGRSDPVFAESVVELARLSGYPIVADPLSGLRHSPRTTNAAVLSSYDLLLQAAPAAWPQARVILRFGDVPTSAPLNAYVERCAPEHYLHVRRDGVWADDLHLVRQYWRVDEALLCRAIVERSSIGPIKVADSAWRDRFERLERMVGETAADFLDDAPLYDGLVAATLWQGLPSGTTLFVGNSLPIRHVDAYGRSSVRDISLFGNRGASGIDGNVSTAIGIAAGGSSPVVALLGDITFYHDMNGLLALHQPGIPPVTFVVLNNDGGGIFRRLPVAKFDPPFTQTFLTPHGLTFEHAAALYGLDYQRIEDKPDLAWLTKHLQSLHTVAQGSPKSTLFEVITDGQVDLDYHRRLIRAIAKAVSSTTHDGFKQ